MLLNAVQFILELFLEIASVFIKCDSCVVWSLNNEIQYEVQDAENKTLYLILTFLNHFHILRARLCYFHHFHESRDVENEFASLLGIVTYLGSLLIKMGFVFSKIFNSLVG
jgi:hypothetical protein